MILQSFARISWLALAVSLLLSGCQTPRTQADTERLQVNSAGDLAILHPARVYPPNTPYAGQPIDTLLSAPPVEPEAALARKYFPEFDPAKERVFSNVSSGIEGEFYVVKVAYHQIPDKAAVGAVGLVHENFDRNYGLMHGYFLFAAADGHAFEFVPQDPQSTRLKAFESRYLVAGLEGLRLRGMPFGIINATNGSFMSSWNLYTLESVTAMTAGTSLIDKLHASRADVTTPLQTEWASPPYTQTLLLNVNEAQEAFDSFMRRALHLSLKQPYSLYGKTCNHTIEDILKETSFVPSPAANMPQAPVTALVDGVKKTLGWYHPAYFSRRIELLGYAASGSLAPALQEPAFKAAFEHVVRDHQAGWRYSRQ